MFAYQWLFGLLACDSNNPYDIYAEHCIDFCQVSWLRVHLVRHGAGVGPKPPALLGC
jgi:hypothetical protein